VCVRMGVVSVGGANIVNKLGRNEEREQKPFKDSRNKRNYTHTTYEKLVVIKHLFGKDRIYINVELQESENACD